MSRGFLLSAGEAACLCAVFAVLTAYASGLHLINELPPALLLFIQAHGTEAVSAIPEACMPLEAIGGFVIDEQHFLLVACNFRFHFGAESGLCDLPKNLGIGFGTIKKGSASGPELAEIEFIIPALVIELPQKLAVQSETEYL